MGLLVLCPKKTHVPENLEFAPYSIEKNKQIQVQGINCKVNDHSIAFLYCRVTPTIAEAEHILGHTQEIQYLMGDLNLDPQHYDQEQKLDIIKGSKISILNEATTKRNTQLDHILGNVPGNTLVYATSFRNFVSDHKTITIRISEPGFGANFIDDPRLMKQKED